MALVPPGVSLDEADNRASAFWRRAEWQSEDALAAWERPSSISHITVLEVAGRVPASFVELVRGETIAHLRRLEWMERASADDAHGPDAPDSVREMLAAEYEEAFPTASPQDMRAAVADFLRARARERGVGGAAGSVRDAHRERVLTFAARLVESMRDDDDRLRALLDTTTIDAGTREWAPSESVADALSRVLNDMAAPGAGFSQDRRDAVRLVDHLVAAATRPYRELERHGGAEAVGQRLQAIRGELGVPDLDRGERDRLSAEARMLHAVLALNGNIEASDELEATPGRERSERPRRSREAPELRR